MLLFVIPGLYFVRLVSGALPRWAADLDRVYVVRLEDEVPSPERMGREELEQRRDQLHKDGWRVVDMAATPVLVADGLGAVLLFLIGQLLQKATLLSTVPVATFWVGGVTPPWPGSPTPGSGLGLAPMMGLAAVLGAP